MAESSSLGNKSQRELVTALVEELKKSTQKDREATLSTLKKIYDNIIQHPNDDKYRQIKLTNKTFSNDVWPYPAAVNLMKMAGWEVDGDCVRLRDNSDAKVISELLEKELQIMLEPTPIRPRFHENVNSGASSSSKCCTPTDKAIIDIVFAIQHGDGSALKKLLSPYHVACVKNRDFARLFSIIECVCLYRQIGIARILVNNYGVDFNSLDEEGEPDYFMLFQGCNSTESCQSLIIDFIKGLKIDVHRPTGKVTALHYAVLHKLFTVVKFLVEDCKVDVNCVCHKMLSGTPLHMAYAIGEESIAQYLIEHGADQDAIDSDGRKPIDYKLYVGSLNYYAVVSQFFIKRAVICTKPLSDEHVYFTQSCENGTEMMEAVELTFQEFPSLKKRLDDTINIANQQNLEATPTLKELNHYITEMAPSYHNIGLELDVVNSKLKVIQSDPSLPDLEMKCRKMLEVWLENDTSATWKKLCDALQEVGMNVLAERIKKQL